MNRIFFGFAILAIINTSCGNSSKPEKEEVKNQEAEISNDPRPLVLIYMDLKNSLVESDYMNSRELSFEMKDALDKSFGDTFEEVMKIVVANLTAANTIDEQRKYFEQVSELLYGKLVNQGAERTVYKQFCPMAFDNQGAYWLSFNEDIENPYFGDAMLNCGYIQDTLVAL